MEDKEIAELHKLMDMYRESVERLYNAIEIAAMRQLAEDERRSRNVVSKSNRARRRARGASNVASV